MNTELAIRQGNTPARQSFNQDQIDLITRTICKGATPDELDLFLTQCNRTGLDPLLKQIHAVKRWDSTQRREIMSIQVAIDGFRLIAERTGQYEGQTNAQWCGEDGEWRDVWLASKPPSAARVGVYRTGFREPLYAVARYDSFVQKTKEGNPNRFWQTMPDIMLLKVAESQALRKAFPQELSGLYTQDEMAQAENEPRPEHKPLPANASEGLIKQNATRIRKDDWRWEASKVKEMNRAIADGGDDPAEVINYAYEQGVKTPEQFQRVWGYFQEAECSFRGAVDSLFGTYDPTEDTIDAEVVA